MILAGPIMAILYKCRHSLCEARLTSSGYCPLHAKKLEETRREAQKRYDTHNRNKDARKFYGSPQWATARKLQIERAPTCRVCGRPAECVHHNIPLSRLVGVQRLDPSNLVSLCNQHHSMIEAARARGEPDPTFDEVYREVDWDRLRLKREAPPASPGQIQTQSRPPISPY